MSDSENESAGLGFAVIAIVVIFIVFVAIIAFIIVLGLLLARNVIFKYSRSAVVATAWFGGHLAFFGHMIFVIFLRDDADEDNPILHYEYPSDYILDTHPAIVYVAVTALALIFTIVKHQNLTDGERRLVKYEEILNDSDLGYNDNIKLRYNNTIKLCDFDVDDYEFLISPQVFEYECFMPQKVVAWHLKWREVIASACLVIFGIPIVSAILVLGFVILDALFGIPIQYHNYVYFGLGFIVLALGALLVIKFAGECVEFRRAKSAMRDCLAQPLRNPNDEIVRFDVDVIVWRSKGGVPPLLKMLLGAVAFRGGYKMGQKAAKGLM